MTRGDGTLDGAQACAESYAELGAITNFSFLRGGSHGEEMVAQARALGLTALAVADRNTLAGVVRAHVAAKQVGLKLIVGARLCLADGTPDLICLPTNRAAYGRLSKLLSKGKLLAGKGDCHLTLDDVVAAVEGQIVLVVPGDDLGWSNREDVSAGAAQNRFADRLAALSRRLGRAHGIYLAAACRYDGRDGARLAVMAEIAERSDVAMVATNLPVYHAPHRKPLQDVLTCIREKTTISKAGFLLEANAERHLKSPSEMRRLFRKYPDALRRTHEIASECRFSLDELVYEYPNEPVPDGMDPQTYLESLTWDGARWRFNGDIPHEIRATIEKELRLIRQLDYARYFLTVYDIVKFARSQNILCQGRGSAANSVVCYCLGITAVNPAEVNLLFERFISPERKEPPDIDVDFEHDRREDVIQYIYARYGRARAGLTATVISYRSRSALREVGKAMGLSEYRVSALTGMVWGYGRGGAVADRHVHEAGLDPDDPLLARVLELADELIGFPRHLSQHVGGFVLTCGPLTEVVPIGNAAMEERTFIEWDKDDIEALGLLKIDVLALGMLSCIQRAFGLLETHYARPLTLARVPRDDAQVYDMLCRADSVGVFQVESRAQMNMLPRLKPRTYYDLVIEVAIVRPGPIQGDMVHPYLRRRNGEEAEVYPAPAPQFGPPDELKRILGKTKGVPLFQEQAMRIAMEAAKFDSKEINELRRALATFRKRGTIHLLEEKMVQRMVERGYDAEFAARCFNQIKGFGEYGFPESHAASFAHLVYVSSWIKCHYPDVFCCALLNSQPMGFYAPAQLVRDAREHGVEVRPPDINHSDWDSTLEPRGDGDVRGRALRLGLRQIDGVGEGDMKRLCAARETGGRFQTVEDLHKRSGLRPAVIEKLATADAMRSLSLDRRQALWRVKALSAGPTLPLFEWTPRSVEPEEASVALPEMALSEHVVSDYQTLRLSLKAHPMAFLRPRLERMRGVTCAGLKDLRDGAWVTVGGVILVRQRPGSAKGVVFMTLEDETGVCNTVVWPNTMERYRKVIMTARAIVVHGRIQRHEDIIHIVSQRLEDRSDWLLSLSDWAEDMRVPIANADEVLRPDPGSARNPDHTRWSGHPRGERVIPKRIERIVPKSRDFH
jgi:error-prone DNA polymerase